MEKLKQAIVKKGTVLADGVLKVDAFLNHQIDPKLSVEIGKEFAERFKDHQVTKVLTIEASGIAPGLTTALELNVPLVFARKKKSITMNENVYVENVFSFTKKEVTEITVSKDFLNKDDHILIIDDFLANGEAALGLARLVEQASAKVSGIGIVIEKSFQPGREKLTKAGYHVESLAQIASLKEKTIRFAEELVASKK